VGWAVRQDWSVGGTDMGWAMGDGQANRTNQLAGKGRGQGRVTGSAGVRWGRGAQLAKLSRECEDLSNGQVQSRPTFCPTGPLFCM
jgi:hypothetical protein